MFSKYYSGYSVDKGLKLAKAEYQVQLSGPAVVRVRSGADFDTVGGNGSEEK